MRLTIIWFIYLMLLISGCESSTTRSASNPPSSNLSTPATTQPPRNPILEMSDQQLEELKPTVKKLFTDYLRNREEASVPDDRRIKDFIVHDNIQIFKNVENVYFIVPYDTLAATKEYVLAGGGELNGDGWHTNRELLVLIEKSDGQYRIKSVSSGP